MTVDNSTFAEVLSYAARGWAVFPVFTIDASGQCDCYGSTKKCTPGKHPRTKNGLNDATCDPTIISHWWERWPNANVGLATGAASRLVVLDVDPGHGGDETLTDLELLHGKLPQTVEVLTGGGGRHVYFRWPGRAVPNSAGKIGPGLDVRGDGGYVVVPPSLHQSGQRYQWEISSDPSDVELAEIPAWLLQLMADIPSRNGTVAGVSTPPSMLPVSKQALDFVANGAPVGQQRDRAVPAARSYLGAGYSVADTVAAIWRGFQASPIGDLSKPWTQQDALDIAQDLASKPASPPAPLRKPQNMPGNIPSSAALTPLDSPLRRTDAANAEFFAHLYGDKMRYDHSRGRWLRWATHWWTEDSDAEVRRLAQQAAKKLYQQAAGVSNPEVAKKLAGWAISSLQRKGLDAAVSLAQAQLPIADRGDCWDMDPWLLGVANGVVDLRTGELRVGQQSDRITKHTDVQFDPSATCPMWLAFLDRIMAGNQNLISFLQRAVGYSLTGIVSERVIFILHGQGANGKSTLLEIIRCMLGDYAIRTPTETLMMKQQSSIPNDIARLRGSRFVFASETESGKRLAEALIKDLTGDDTISARFMRAEFFDFKPEFKIWMGTNHKPVIKGTDKAIWDRLKLIPFNVRIPEGERDQHLPEKLKAELPGILQWAIEGCLEWQRSGLGVPEEVRSATESYRKEMDILASFLGECCILKANCRVGALVLHKAYVEWCEANDEKAEKIKSFTNRLKECGFNSRRTGKNGSVEWHGIGLRTDEVTEGLNDTEASSGLTLTENGSRGINRETPSVSFSASVTDNKTTPVAQAQMDLSEPETEPAGIQIATAKVAIDQELYEALLRQGISQSEAVDRARVIIDEDDELCNSDYQEEAD